MIPTSNLTDVAIKAVGSEPDFKLVHPIGKFTIHSAVIFTACTIEDRKMWETFTYTIDEKDLPVDLFIEALYCNFDKCDHEGVTGYEFGLLADEMEKLGMKFTLKHRTAWFVHEMIRCHSWFKGMSLYEKNQLHRILAKDDDDICIGIEHVILPCLYAWSKNTKFFNWKTFTAELCSQYAKQMADAREIGITDRYQSEWFSHSILDLPWSYIHDLPVTAIHQIYNFSINFWILILMGISDYQFDLYRTTYYGGEEYSRDEHIFINCEKVRRGYIGNKEVHRLKNGVGENDDEKSSYSSYWPQVLCSHLWKDPKYRNQSHVDFIDHLVGSKVA